MANTVWRWVVHGSPFTVHGSQFTVTVFAAERLNTIAQAFRPGKAMNRNPPWKGGRDGTASVGSYEKGQSQNAMVAVGRHFQGGFVDAHPCLKAWAMVFSRSAAKTVNRERRTANCERRTVNHNTSCQTPGCSNLSFVILSSAQRCYASRI
jgi:hypothetical protein